MNNRLFDKIAIIGSRTFCNYEFMKDILKDFKFNSIVSGGARGADSLAKRYAKENNVLIEEFIPEWDKYGKSAGFKRNKLIIDQSDAIIAFWDGASKGTAHSIRLAKEARKNIYIFWKE